jgi:hypothetical protein
VAQPLLTSVPKVIDYLNSPVSEDGQRILKDYIHIASGLVRKYTGRRFSSPRDEGVTREFYMYGRTRTYIDEVFSAADITAVTDEYGVALNYTLDFGNEYPSQGADLTITPLYQEFGVKGLPADHSDFFIRELGGVATQSVPTAIRVTGDFGYEEGAIPREVEFATRRTVALWYKEEVANYTEGAFISRGREFNPEELPAIVLGMLESTWKVDRAVLI